MNNESGNALLVTLREAQQRLGIGRTQLHELCRTGAIRSIKIGRRGIRIPVSELERFVAEQLDGAR